MKKTEMTTEQKLALAEERLETIGRIWAVRGYSAQEKQRGIGSVLTSKSVTPSAILAIATVHFPARQEVPEAEPSDDDAAAALQALETEVAARSSPSAQSESTQSPTALALADQAGSPLPPDVVVPNNTIEGELR